jgi:hypothetical protein
MFDFLHFQQKSSGGLFIFIKKYENIFPKFLGPPASSAEVMTFRVMHYIRVRNCFWTMGFMGIKRRRIVRRFQKYKLALASKCTYKKLFQDNFV